MDGIAEPQGDSRRVVPIAGEAEINAAGEFIPPDWKDATQYPAAGKGSFSFWAWQFLRRNTRYQAAWRDYRNRMRTMLLRLPEVEPYLAWLLDARWSAALADRDEYCRLGNLVSDQVESVVIDGLDELPSGMTLREYYKSTRARGGWSLASIELAKPFGLEQLVTPCVEWRSTCVRFSTSGAMLKYVGPRNPYWDPATGGDPNYECPIFDLRLPVRVLKAQFAQVLDRRKSDIDAGMVQAYDLRPGRQRSNFPVYLRTLDAMHALGRDEAIPEIASHMLAHLRGDQTKTVRNWVRRAESLRDGGYQLLPTADEYR